jgi:hypothetical protein
MRKAEFGIRKKKGKGEREKGKGVDQERKRVSIGVPLLVGHSHFCNTSSIRQPPLDPFA